MEAEVLENPMTDLRDVKERLKRIERNMVTKDDVEALIESLGILSENPKILEDIDKAIEEYKGGEYYRYDEVFGEK